MTRQLPLCAFCGKSIRHTDFKGCRMTLQYRKLAGAPTIGWHYDVGEFNCGEQDELFAALQPCRPVDTDVVPLLRIIEARGPGRVIAGPAWHQMLMRRTQS